MPVTSQVGGKCGNDNDVALSDLNCLVAAGTDVVLGRLIGLDKPDFRLLSV